MKCPKCGYLGFETVDRCRNCGYDFSLAHVPPPPSAELPLNEGRGAGAALADFDLSPKSGGRSTPALDLDRLIGVEPEPPATHDEPPVVDERRLEPAPIEVPAADESLPLFTNESAALDDAPMVAPPRPAGPPLAVRRATHEVPRGRPRGVRPPRRDDRALAFEPEPTDSAAEYAETASPRVSPGTSAAIEAAPRGTRLVAAAIDVVLLGSINVAVLYLTLQLAGITLADLHMLPVAPMGSFLLMLDGGYLAAFTAAGGKTIGKMATGIRVIGDDGRAVDASGAVLRAIGGLLTVMTLGLPYLPALFSADGRTLADRLAGTRVVRGD